MNKIWQEFIEQIKLSSTETAGSSQENKAALTGNSHCNLDDYGLIVIAGPDAMDFMQGQFTNDVNQVDSGNAQLSALCNNKGRMIANFTLFKYQENYFLSLHKELVDTVVEVLQRYILRAQVAVQDISNQLIQTGVCGEKAMHILAEQLTLTGSNQLKSDKLSVSANDNYIVIKTPDELPRYLVLAEADASMSLWQAMAPVSVPVQKHAWEFLNIQAGIPVINAKTSGEFVPQMANMELLNGVNFKKGCYTGQEIVARMHYLGKLKKRMYKIHIDTNDETTPCSGDRVFASNAKAGQNTGIIINAQRNPESGYDALAVIQIADIDAELRLHDNNGPVITVKQLPYSFDS